MIHSILKDQILVYSELLPNISPVGGQSRIKYITSASDILTDDLTDNQWYIGQQIIVSKTTVKILKFGTPQTIAIIVLKIEKFDVTCVNASKRCWWNGKQRRPWSNCFSEAVWSWSALFAEIYLSLNGSILLSSKK